jgi:hypothetical protein
MKWILCSFVAVVFGQGNSSQGNTVQTCSNVVVNSGNSARNSCTTMGSDAHNCRTGVNAAQGEANQQCNQSGGAKKRDLRSHLTTEQLEQIHANLVKRDNCWYSVRWNQNVCLDLPSMVSLGRKINEEACTTAINGKQKCIGDRGFITCVNGNWTIQQICGGGTRCQTHPSSSARVLCGW